jgi:hypothetical protein
MTHYEILTEEQSAEEFLERLVPRLGVDESRFDVYSFRGKEDLKTKLEDRLQGYGSFLAGPQGVDYSYVIVILIDQDDDDCLELKEELASEVSRIGLDDQVKIRIAVKELESWYLGDPEALRSEFQRLPSSFENRSKFRNPEAMNQKPSEALDQLLRDNGYKSGLQKVTTAQKMGGTVDTQDENDCHSFHVFRNTFV